MSKYRSALPQLSARLFLTDGGLETTLVFHEGMDLPYFAAFGVLASGEGRRKIRRYYAEYAATARVQGLGFVLEAPSGE